MDGPVVVPQRDRPTWISYAQLAAYGWFLYAFGPSLVLLRDEQGTSRAVSSLHGTMLAVGAVAAGLLVARLVAWIGRGAVLRVGTLALVAGMLGYTAGGGLPVTLGSMLVAGVGASLLLAAVNAFIAEHQGRAAPVSLSEGNAGAAFFGLMGPLVVGVGVAFATWGWRIGLWVAALAFLVIEVVRGRDLRVFDGTSGHPEGEPGHDPGGRMPALFWWSWLTLVLLIGVEFCLTLWGSDLLRSRGGLGPAASAAALAAIVGGMAIGRFAGSRVLERADPERLLAGAILLAGAGFALTWVVPAAVPMVAGLFVAGLGVGLHFPLGITRAIRASGGRSDRASGLGSVGAGIATGGAPFVLGALADGVGVHLAFLVVPALLAGALVLLLARPVPA
ncbi:MAG: hypothetical protein R2737_06650 [Candidatus Nanopelagicales bacterium]